MLVQAFIAEAPVERFDVGILVRFARHAQELSHATRLRLGQHRPTAELLAVVRANRLWQITMQGQTI